MESTISKLLDFFKHIARDILIYVLSGLIVIGNILLVDVLYNSSLIFNHLKYISYLPLLITLTAYILGHIIMGIMLIIDLAEKLFSIDDINQKDEIKIYNKNSNTYEL